MTEIKSHPTFVGDPPARAVVGSGWIACRDTVVCSGSRQNQKWCVREGNDKGPLVAVMLTKDVAFLLAASPSMLAGLKELVDFCDDPEGDAKPESLASGLARMLPGLRAAIALAEGRGS